MNANAAYLKFTAQRCSTVVLQYKCSFPFIRENYLIHFPIIVFRGVSSICECAQTIFVLRDGVRILCVGGEGARGEGEGRREGGGENKEIWRELCSHTAQHAKPRKTDWYPVEKENGF